MNRVLVYICIGLCASSAGADSRVLDLWLSTNSDVSSLPAPGNAVLPAGYTGKVYLYARSAGAWQSVETTYQDNDGAVHPWNYTDWVGDLWHGISLGTTTTIGFAGTISNPAANGSPRWWSGADFTWANADQFNVWTVLDRGAGGAAPPSPPGTSGSSIFDSQQACSVPPVPGNSGYVYTRMGTLTIVSAPANARFFMTIGTGTIDCKGITPDPDLVQFGTGDAPVPAAEIFAVSSLPDLTVLPEPGSVLLIGVASLVLRRR